MGRRGGSPPARKPSLLSPNPSPSREVVEATGLGGQFTQLGCSVPRPTTRPPTNSHANEALSAPGPFELMWGNRWPVLGKSCMNGQGGQGCLVGVGMGGHRLCPLQGGAVGHSLSAGCPL